MYRPNEESENKNRYEYGPGIQSENREKTGWSHKSSGSIPLNEGEYRLSRDEIPKPEYTDASYVSASEASPMPRSFSPQAEKQKREKKTRKKHTGGFNPAAIVAMCLICAIFGGIAGGALGFAQGNEVTQDMAERLELLEKNDGQQDNAVTPPTSTGKPISSTSGGDTLTGADIYSLGCPQTVGINSEVTTTNIFGQPTTAATSGSGFIIRSNGYIVTNYHVIETAVKNNLDINVMLYTGESHIADMVGYEKENDIAVLKIDAEDLPTAAFGDSDEIRVGENVYAIGNPLGELSYTMTSGMVSALDREITTQSDNSYGTYVDTINMFQFDAAVNSGNSGGPLYNSRGEVIGVVTAKYQSTGVEGLGFAIPSSDAEFIVNELISKGYVGGKPDFGIRVNTVDSSVAQYYNMVVGAYIYSMDSEGAAARAGLEVGDIIVKLDETEISSIGDLKGAKKNYAAGDSAGVVVFRGGEYLEFTLVFDEEPRDERTYDEGGQDPEADPNSGNVQQIPDQPDGGYQIPDIFDGLFR